MSYGRFRIGGLEDLAGGDHLRIRVYLSALPDHRHHHMAAVDIVHVPFRMSVDDHLLIEHDAGQAADLQNIPLHGRHIAHFLRTVGRKSHLCLFLNHFFYMLFHISSLCPHRL